MEKPLSTYETLNLVAASGWCAPSDIIYDKELPPWPGIGGTLHLPSIHAVRGGIRHEAVKSCTPVPCPPIVDVKLDVEADSLMDQLRMAADDMRRAYRLSATAPIEVTVPDDEAVGWDAHDGETPEERMLRIVTQDMLADRYGSWTRDLVFPQWMYPVMQEDLQARKGASTINALAPDPEPFGRYA